MIEINKPIYDKDELSDDIEFFRKKLGFTNSEYLRIMSSKPKLHDEFKSYKKLYDFLSRNKKAFILVKKSLNRI